MGHLVYLAAALNILLCFGLPQSQGNHVFQPIKLSVSMNRALQQLLLEWDVTDNVEAYPSGVEMVFNIQINRSEENNIVFNENYTTTLNKSNRPLKLTWYSDVPLECMRHAVRIRSMVASSETWSNWSDWNIKDGMDSLDNNRSYILPTYKVVEKGSNVTFCCIAKRNHFPTSYLFHKDDEQWNTTQRRETFTKNNVLLSPLAGFGVYCVFSNLEERERTSLFVTSKPDKPKDFNCETEDMTMLTCTWDPGRRDDYTNLPQDTCATNFTVSDVSNGQTYCNCSEKCRNCIFKMFGEQMKYNLRLTTQNCLGQEQTDAVVDVAQRIHLAPPDQLSVSYQNATTIQLQWHIKPTKKALSLYCQINRNSFYPGVEEEYNTTVWSIPDSCLHTNLNGLQPHTKYTLKVRCAAADFFWKWSEWSNTIAIQTNESAPSGQLDIWRDISPGLEERNVTVFWKASPGFHDNGEIKTYEICWENLEEPHVPSHCNSTELYNYTISLGSQSYKISVTARNSANASTPSVIIISATGKNEETLNYYEEDTTNNTADRIYISWKTQDAFDGYVIDWCNYPMSQPCGFQWMRFGQNVSSTLIPSEAFSPGVKYTFRVYGVQGDRTYALEKKVKYLKEQVPAQLAFNISEITSDLLTINWESYPQNSQPGFIRGYNVYVKVERGNCTLKDFEQFPGNPMICRYTIKDGNEKKYTVKHLEPSTTYLLAVQAYSINPGNITSDKFVRVTTQPKRNWIFPLLLLIIVPLLLIVCACFWKSDCVRNCLIPEIPHPYVHPFAPTFGKKNPVITENSEITTDKIVVVKNPGADKQPVLGRSLGLKILNPNYCQNLQGHNVASKKPNTSWTPYQPFPDFLLSKATDSPLETVGDNLSYVSQNKLPFFGLQKSNSACSIGSLQRSDYKPQLTTESPPNSFVSDDTIHLITV